ncbi:MAG: 16S rRNA (uracil(1498)-N(3))-methyltransferase [Parahaliea sp.]
MRVPRIHTPQALAAGAELTLEPGPSAHLVRVLRLGNGAALALFDGVGNEFAATLTAAARHAVVVRLGERLPNAAESPLAIELGIGISRGERMDWVLQKATELGVASVVPLLTERTEVRLRAERAQKKQQHWQQVMVSACEQCGRARLPALSDPRPLADWARDCRAERRYVLHHRATPAGGSGAPASVALAVGPEGGLSETEIDLCLAAGFTALTLGPRVLRTETAPLAALAIVQSHWGDMALHRAEN